jgi:hypothetical protein
MDEQPPLGAEDHEQRTRWLVNGGADQVSAIKDITNEALRLAASGLVQQLTQARVAESKLRAGTREL